MKKIAYIFMCCLLLVGFNACTDDFEEINTNKNVLYDVDLDDIFVGTVKKTIDMIAGENIYWLNAANYAYTSYVGTPNQNEGIFGKAYTDVLRDIEVLNTEYANDTVGLYDNRRAVILTWRSYVYYMLASCYGPVPMSDAIVKGQEVKYEFKYDDEKTIYTQILNDLELADSLFNAETTWGEDLLFPDMVFGSAADKYAPNIAKWEKFANTLRLQIAMHAQRVLDPTMVAYHAQAVMNEPTKIIASLDEMVAPSFGFYDDGLGSPSWYYNRRRTDETQTPKRWNDGNYPRFSEYMYIYMASFNDPRLTRYALKSSYYGPTFQLGWTPTIETVFLYNDTITRPHSCLDPLNPRNSAMQTCKDYTIHQVNKELIPFMRDSLVVRYTVPILPASGGAIESDVPASWTKAQEQRKTGQTLNQDGTITPQYSDFTYEQAILQNRREYNISYVAEKFTAENAQVVMLSWADACFLQAEAALYLGLSDADAQKYYENGIKASFAQHGVTAADSISAYLAQPGIAWRTDGIGYSDNRQLYRASIMGASGQKDLNGVEINEGALDQIYKQRWMADFFNGLEGWNLERRTRAMNFLPFFNAGRSTDVEGVNASYNYWTERYIFPRSELNNNKASYYDAIVKLQENSDYTQPFNEGNNVFTSLGFAKKIPDIESANQRFGQSRQMKNHCEYFSHYYGATYEKMEEVFIKASGRTSVNMITRPLAINEGKLKLCYEETRLLFWYKTADYPVTPAP